MSKHVKMCKPTNTPLPPSGKLWLSGCMRACICEGTRIYDYSSGNNSPTGVNEASDWRSSLTVSTEYGRQFGLELNVWESPGEERERASWEPVLMGNVKRCSGGRVWLAPRLHCTSPSHLGDDPCRLHPDTLNNKIHLKTSSFFFPLTS